MHSLLQDLRYAVRLLLRQPVFTLIALLTLALGIGANTAIFSLIDAVLLRPLPFPDAGRLVSVWGFLPGSERDDTIPLSLPRYELIRDQQDVFEDLGVAAYDGFTLTGQGDPAQIQGCYLSARFFQTLGASPLQGRLFLPAEDLPGGPRVVVVSEAFWRQHCGADPSLLGRALNLNGSLYQLRAFRQAQKRAVDGQKPVAAPALQKRLEFGAVDTGQHRLCVEGDASRLRKLGARLTKDTPACRRRARWLAAKRLQTRGKLRQAAL